MSTKRAAAEEKSAPGEKRWRIGTRLTVLVHDKYNCAWLNYYQTSRQDATLTLLDKLGIPTDVVDGMRSYELQKKDELCDISGIRESPRRPYRGQVYPQIFLSSESGEEHCYLGGYDWLHDTDWKQLAALCDIPLNERESLGLALFPNAFRSGAYEDADIRTVGRYPRTLIELKMLQIMQAIAEKPNWQSKLRDDPSIFHRWVKESHVHESVVRYAIDEMLSRDIDIQVIQGGPKSLTDLCINVVRQSLLDFKDDLPNGLPQEIVDRITATNDCSGIKFMGLEGVYARDDIGDALHAKLCSGVERLRQHLHCETAPDWHPGSNEQMLDLVHPSLFLLISGLSQCVMTTSLPWSELLTGSCDSEVMNFVLPSDCLLESMFANDRYHEEVIRQMPHA